VLGRAVQARQYRPESNNRAQAASPTFTETSARPWFGRNVVTPPAVLQGTCEPGCNGTTATSIAGQ
jgi:hypothetical protein